MLRSIVVKFCVVAVAVSLLSSCATTGSKAQTEGQGELDAWLNGELSKRGVLSGQASPSTTLRGV